MAIHTYQTHLTWAGSTGSGIREYPRNHSAIAPPAKTAVELSADPHYRGDPDLTNPEQLLLMAASSCQMLSFLALAALAGIDVVGYVDDARAVMPESDGPMRITEMVLSPRITVSAGADVGRIDELVEKAHESCFIANSLTSAITIDTTVVTK